MPDPILSEKILPTISHWAQEFGFSAIGISNTDLSQAEQQLSNWLAHGYQGSMHWMARHGTKRTRPEELVPDTIRVISVRMDYLPKSRCEEALLLNHPEQAYISRYALGRDYHKLIRKRLKLLAEKIRAEIGEMHYRVFTDSAPVMEKPLGQKAGLGWVGKHTNLLSRTGSWFFLGEIYTDLPLPISEVVADHCGECTACIDVCPTQAIIAPYQLDARKCISYLTIEHEGSIPEALRPHIGNRIYGCDDCQLICPWNRFAQSSKEPDFQARHELDQITLLELLDWEEGDFLTRFEGSPIRRIGFTKWQRNLAIALGNSLPRTSTIEKLTQKKTQITDPMVLEHLSWAIDNLKRNHLSQNSERLS